MARGKRHTRIISNYIYFCDIYLITLLIILIFYGYLFCLIKFIYKQAKNLNSATNLFKNSFGHFGNFEAKNRGERILLMTNISRNLKRYAFDVRIVEVK